MRLSQNYVFAVNSFSFSSDDMKVESQGLVVMLQMIAAAITKNGEGISVRFIHGHW